MNDWMRVALELTLVVVLVISLISGWLLRRKNAELVASNAVLKKERDAHEEMSLKDPLTGVNNRRAIELYMEYELQRIVRYGGYVSCMFIDLDGFKLVNDTRGHLVGDQLLQMLGDSFVSSFRYQDKVGRLGGDEFIILMSESDEDISSAKADLVLEIVRDVARDCGVQVTASIGVITLDENHGLELPGLLSLMDKQQYAAKRGGGDRWFRAIQPKSRA